MKEGEGTEGELTVDLGFNLQRYNNKKLTSTLVQIHLMQNTAHDMT